MEKIVSGKHEFEIVEHVPQGYEIWNIGENMIDGYLPLAQVDSDYKVNPKTLKAIKVDGAQIILSAVGYKPKTVKGMEKFINKYDGNKSKQWIVDKIKKALPIMRTIKGL
ncbi:hypothetical protein [Breznakia pachnodae]|uniref:Uncharacterized protein n=1 Tax=Breznakia pachnodae TaxID=265178 RepID=A0ABU0DZK4_9FIRM|nr:hypothetical protein [Breznakia pachnodae]MDQ0360011.1 hypothetical protein [Breznakia pachnodae]